MSTPRKNPELHRPGIYEITNSRGFHKYVGQACNIAKRWRQHIKDLRNNRHGNSYLQNAWNRYGEKRFSFKVIEFCKIKDLDTREQYWINKLKPEYNLVMNIAEGSASITKEREPKKYYEDEDRDLYRPEWHKWVYGGQRKPR